MEDRDGKAPPRENRYDNDETVPTNVVSPGYMPSSTTFYPEAQLSLEDQPVLFSSSPASPHKLYTPSEQPDEANRLRGQVRWLRISLIASVVVLGSALAGVFLGVRQEQAAIRNVQEDLSAQINTIEDAIPSEQVSPEAPSAGLPTVAIPSGEQINRIEEQLKTLNEQTKTLLEQAEAISEQLPDVSFEQWTDLQGRLSTLEEDIQRNLPDEALSVRFGQLSERIRQLLNQPQAETAEPTTAETLQ